MINESVLLFQALYLFGDIFINSVRLLLSIPVILLQNCNQSKKSLSNVTFYECIVYHARKTPATHALKYDVRTAVIELDNPPKWFSRQSLDHMNAQQARLMAKTDGPVKLLTNPEVAGYCQNPISVYYCYSAAGNLEICIAEVTNTPWGERVTFLFDPAGEKVNKCLHVSPLMDMQSTWHLKTSEPSSSLYLSVDVTHPTLGKFFFASMSGKKAAVGQGLRNEEAGWLVLWKYGFMPHRIAIWIYIHAVMLLWKGVPLYSPPPKALNKEIEGKAIHKRTGALGCPFHVWRDAKSWPWKTE